MGSGWPALLVPVGLVSIWLKNRAKSKGYCSDPACTAALDDMLTTCPGCGGTIAGEIERPGDRLAAEDRLRELERGREPAAIDPSS